MIQKNSDQYPNKLYINILTGFVKFSCFIFNYRDMNLLLRVNGKSHE